MDILLTEKEYSYLLYLASFLNSELSNKIHDYSRIRGDKYKITVSEDEAEIIRDICCDRFDFKGLDEKYEPTQDGILLEILIDKFYMEPDIRSDSSFFLLKVLKRFYHNRNASKL